MAITYKDISLLSQKASIAGTEKIPVSDTQYITPAQILAALSAAFSAGDANKLVYIDSNGKLAASFGVGDANNVYTLSTLKVVSRLIGFECSDFRFIKPEDANITLQDALDAKPDVYSGTSDPSSSLGKNGDIYIKLSSVN